MSEEIKHYQVNGKYRVQFERSAVKGLDGFKVEANDDDLKEVMKQALILYAEAMEKTKPAGEIK